MRMLTEILPADKQLYGFDTFTGLPEDWGDEAAGTYSTSDGQVPGDFSANVKCFQGE